MKIPEIVEIIFLAKEGTEFKESKDGRLEKR